MRVPLSWLREYVDLPATETGRDVQAKLISVGLEVETVEQRKPACHHASRDTGTDNDDAHHALPRCCEAMTAIRPPPSGP